MYTLFRKIHLYCGLILTIFLMMYFVSGYVMIHRPWFLPPFPVPTTQSAELESSPDRPPEQVAADVRKQLSLVGRIAYPTTQPSGMTRFWINHPGVQTRVDVVNSEKRIDVYIQQLGLAGTLIMLHKIYGYDENTIFNIYAFFCDLSGISMVVFAITGVYLWWKRTKNHLLGIICLTLSCLYAGGLMIYLAFTP